MLSRTINVKLYEPIPSFSNINDRATSDLTLVRLSILSKLK